jgi:hypothetical protein
VLRRAAQPDPGSLPHRRPSPARRPLPTAGPAALAWPRIGPISSARRARSRPRLSLLLVVLGLIVAVVAHHALPASGHGGMAGNDHAMAAATTCLGVVSAGVVIAAPLVVRLRRRPRRRPVARLRPAACLLPTGPLPRARSSPLYLRHAVLRR